MKKITFILFANILLTQILFSQDDVMIENYPQQMTEIDKVVSAIKSKTATFKKVEKAKTQEASKFIFLKEKELQFITVKQMENGLEKNVEWYFSNGSLIFSETNWIDLISKKVMAHEKQYLKNGTLLCWLDNENKLVDPISPEFKEVDKRIQTYAVKLKDEAMK